MIRVIQSAAGPWIQFIHLTCCFIRFALSSLTHLLASRRNSLQSPIIPVLAGMPTSGDALSSPAGYLGIVIPVVLIFFVTPMVIFLVKCLGVKKVLHKRRGHFKSSSMMGSTELGSSGLGRVQKANIPSFFTSRSSTNDKKTNSTRVSALKTPQWPLPNTPQWPLKPEPVASVV